MSRRRSAGPTPETLFGVMVANHAGVAAKLAAPASKPPAAPDSRPNDGPRATMSVRLPKHVRAFYAAQAAACGAPSPSAMVAMVLEGLMLASAAGRNT